MAGKREKLEDIVLELRQVEVRSSGWGGLIPPSVWTKRVKMKGIGFDANWVMRSWC